MISAMAGGNASSIGFDSFGVRVAVAAPNVPAELLSAVLPPGRRSCDPAEAEVAFGLVDVPDGTAVAKDGDLLTPGVPLDTALEVLEREVRTEVPLRAP